jgi:transcription termination factor NusB
MSGTDRKPGKDEKRQMKSAARLYAVQALFQMEAAGQSVEKVTREFETHRFGATYDEAIRFSFAGSSTGRSTFRHRSTR